MLYIIVCCRMNPKHPMAFQTGQTHIEFNVDDGGKEELSTRQSAMSSLGARGRNSSMGSLPLYSYETNQPPLLVLNRLEKQAGYKVVAANSVTNPGPNDSFGEPTNYQIWTLHKQA